MKILVVDDDHDSTEALVVLLRTVGHVALGETDSTIAGTAAQRFDADAVILDLGMPLLDGYTLARKLRSHPLTGHMRLIALSGHVYPQHKELSRAAGIDVHLAKPVELAALLEALGDHAQSHARTNGNSRVQRTD